eukprot:COSAG01_NODE_2885_length_6901_cov_101.837028_2_plen_78_part_00
MARWSAAAALIDAHDLFTRAPSQGAAEQPPADDGYAWLIFRLSGAGRAGMDAAAICGAPGEVKAVTAVVGGGASWEI